MPLLHLGQFPYQGSQERSVPAFMRPKHQTLWPALTGSVEMGNSLSHLSAYGKLPWLPVWVIWSELSQVPCVTLFLQQCETQGVPGLGK